MRSKLAPFLMIFVAASLGACGSSDDDGPTARFTAECIEFVCEFDATASISPQGQNLSYIWVFGDGGSASGVNAEHFYPVAGEYEVILQVIDASGDSDQELQTVTTTDSQVIEYYSSLRSVLSTLIFLTETPASVVEVSDYLQDQVETEGPPGEDGYEIACEASGTAEALEWDDADGSGDINGSETVSLAASACTLNSSASIASTSAFSLSGDFDGTNFSIDMPNEVGSGLLTDLVENWYLRGPVDYQATLSGGAIDTLQQSSTGLDLVYRTQSNADFISSLTHDVTSDFGEASNISGNMTLKPGPGASSFPIDVSIDTNVTFAGNDENLAMSAGSMTLLRDGETITIEIAPDPAYLLVHIDSDSDGTVDISDQLPQQITVKRFR